MRPAFQPYRTRPSHERPHGCVFWDMQGLPRPQRLVPECIDQRDGGSRLRFAWSHFLCPQSTGHAHRRHVCNTHHPAPNAPRKTKNRMRSFARAAQMSPSRGAAPTLQEQGTSLLFQARANHICRCSGPMRCPLLPTSTNKPRAPKTQTLAHTGSFVRGP